MFTKSVVNIVQNCFPDCFFIVPINGSAVLECASNHVKFIIAPC